MGLRACSASQGTSKRHSGGFPIEAESDIETMGVGGVVENWVPHASEA